MHNLNKTIVSFMKQIFHKLFVHVLMNKVWRGPTGLLIVNAN